MKYVCRICLKEITDLKFVALKTEEHSHIKMQLSICVPELVVDLVKDPVFCKSCVGALHSAYNFKNQCLQTEERILSFSRKILSSKSIDIIDLLHDLQQSTRNGACGDNGERDNARNGDSAVTPNMNLLLSDENRVNGHNLNTASNTYQYSVMFPADAANEINNVTVNTFCKPTTQATADELNNLLDDPFQNAPIQPRVFKQESENENADITIKEENIALVKVESSVSYEGFENNCFEDAKSGDLAAEVKSLDSKGAVFQTNIVTQNCFVKITRLPEGTVRKRTRFICKICKFTFRTKYYLKKHELIHDKTKRFSFACNVCPFRSLQKSSLRKHLRIHTGEKPFVCNVCTYCSARKSQLQRHLLIHTGEKPFACNVCTFRTNQKPHLQKHLRMHTNEKRFTCNVCNFCFAQKSQLRTHLQIHTSKKLFACSVCTYCAARKSQLKRHLRIHTGEKPFACNVCTYRSAQKSHLQTHLRIHTGEKPFACNICNFRCTQKSYMKLHLQIHSQEKPLSCNICDYRCRYKKELDIHIKHHSADKVYTCSTCKYITPSKCRLTRHIKTHL